MGSSNENSAYRPVQQPLGPLAHPGRLVRRQRRGGGGPAGAGRHRHRHRRLDPPAGLLLRHHRHQADLWPRLALRHDRLRLQPGPGRADGAHGRRTARCCCRPCAAPIPDRDSTSLDVPAEDFTRSLDDSHRRPAHRRADGVLRRRAGRRRARRRSTPRSQEYQKLGAKLVEISLPRTELSIPVYYIIAPAEASSNLSRFDGVKFGHRARQYGDLIDMYKKTRAEGFGDEVKRRIMIGTYVLSHGYYDAYYLQAQKIRRMIADDFQQAFTQCDVIAGPVAPTVAWKIGEKADDPVAELPGRHLHAAGSLAGLPGMSVPCGFGAGGMPVGPATDRQLLRRSAAAERRAPLPAGHRFPSARAGGRCDRRLGHEQVDPGLRSRHRLRDPRPAVDAVEDLQPRAHGVRRRAQHPGLRRWTWPCPARCR